MTSDDLPSFERPPVVETVLGVQFEQLRGFRNAHLGAFWKHLKAYWKDKGDEPWRDLTDAPTLEPAFERFEETGSWRRIGLQLKVTQDPSARIQIRNPEGDRMIQLQNGRLHYNWLGQPGGPYPRYKTVRPEFDRILEQFRQFIEEEGLNPIVPNQWEITYVNHLPKGTVWNDPDDWNKVFVSLPGVWRNPPNIRLESIGGEWHFVIAPQEGRLHVQLGRARAGSPEGEDILRLTLTARGPIADPAKRGLSLDEGLNLGRETIVRTFKAITSDSAHERWGICHARS